MAVEDGSLPSGPPGADAWARVPDDVWAGVVPHLRRALTGLDDALVTPEIRRLRAVPPKRLVTGRSRGAAAALLADGGALWVDLRRRLENDRDLARRVADALQQPSDAAPPPHSEPPSADVANLEEQLLRAKERARQLVEQRDEAIRRADGARARADAAEAAVARLEGRVAELTEHTSTLATRLDQAAEDRANAVDREARRQTARIGRLEEELTEARRQLQEERRRRVDQPSAAPSRPAPRARPAPARRRERPAGFVAGRPSRLSAGVTPGTREAVEEVLHPGRLLLVDGYNVTRRHRDDLDLEGQRGWLIDQLGALAAARGLDVVVVFDGAGGRPSTRRRRGVGVVFTPAGQTADDDLVFQVDALPEDEPVAVATDDRELRERLRPYRIDILGSGELLWMLR